MAKRKRAAKPRRPSLSNGTAARSSDPHPSLPGPFIPEALDRTVIVGPLLELLHKEDPERQWVYSVIIVLNGVYAGGCDAARFWALNQLREILEPRSRQRIAESKSLLTERYLVATLEAATILELARRSRASTRGLDSQPRDRRSRSRQFGQI